MRPGRRNGHILKRSAQSGLGPQVYRRRLRRYLQRADDSKFLQMLWCVDALHSDRAAAAAEINFRFDPALATQSLAAHRVFPWELDTLANELLITPKEVVRPGRQLLLDCSHYGTALECARALRKLENAQDRRSLDRVGVISEMHRLTQRQFEWQWGFADIPTLYRSVRIFGQGPSGAYFEETHGLTVSEFVYLGLILCRAFFGKPVWRTSSPLAQYGVDDRSRQHGLARLAIAMEDARTWAREKCGPQLHTAYRPSVLREHPILLSGQHGEMMTAPLVGLLFQRVTQGLYLDVVGGRLAVWQTIGREFERYAFELLTAMLPGSSVAPERRYHIRKNQFDGPDIEISRNDRIELLVECKAKRLTFEARFSENPLDDAEKAYAEIIKGVFQIWRFASRVRRGLVPGANLAERPVGMVLTLDPWLTMANDQGREVMAAARRMCAEKEPDLTDQDYCPILFTSVRELERCQLLGSEESFFATIAKASDGDHEAWLFSVIHDEVAPEKDEPNDYPFADDIKNLLPWWPKL